MLGFRKSFAKRGVVTNVSAPSPTSFTYVGMSQAIFGTNTLPSTNAGDLAILFQSAFNNSTTPPTDVAPSGWTKISDTTDATNPAGRMSVYYKILVAGDSNSTISVITGTNVQQSQIQVYRPNTAINSLQISTINSQGSSGVPTAQTLTMTGLVGPYIGVATYASNGSVSASTSVTPTRTTGPSGGHYLKFFEAVNSSTSFSTSTVSMTDAGTNLMASYTIKLL